MLQYLYSGRDNVAIGKLWLMAKHGVLVCRTYILAEDLEHFLEPEKAQQAFDILDVDGDGQVTLHNIRDAVVSIYQVTLCIYRHDCLKTLPPRCCSEQLGIALQRQVMVLFYARKRARSWLWAALGQFGTPYKSWLSSLGQCMQQHISHDLAHAVHTHAHTHVTAGMSHTVSVCTDR